MLHKASVLFFGTVLFALIGASTLMFSDTDVQLVRAVLHGMSGQDQAVQR